MSEFAAATSASADTRPSRHDGFSRLFLGLVALLAIVGLLGYGPLSHGGRTMNLLKQTIFMKISSTAQGRID